MEFGRSKTGQAQDAIAQREQSIALRQACEKVEKIASRPLSNLACWFVVTAAARRLRTPLLRDKGGFFRTNDTIATLKQLCDASQELLLADYATNIDEYRKHLENLTASTRTNAENAVWILLCHHLCLIPSLSKQRFEKLISLLPEKSAARSSAVALADDSANLVTSIARGLMISSVLLRVRAKKFEGKPAACIDELRYAICDIEWEEVLLALRKDLSEFPTLLRSTACRSPIKGGNAAYVYPASLLGVRDSSMANQPARFFRDWDINFHQIAENTGKVPLKLSAEDFECGVMPRRPKTIMEWIDLVQSESRMPDDVRDCVERSSNYHQD